MNSQNGFFINITKISAFHSKCIPTIYRLKIQVTASDGDKDRPQNIVYFLTGQGIDPDNPANSKFDINRTTGEIFVLKVSLNRYNILFLELIEFKQSIIILTPDASYIFAY